ncbi:MAG: tRNA (cytidine(34)-2'-O)-methyltransferase [Verrucomicrobia bacterium]|nr:tRNA (cytidine(34)-2'-O)-methyltransferase [Verrucomicrobiota bacterium]
MNVVLIEPEIPPNTGNIARLCMASNTTLHLVEPFGFRIDDATLKRAGMDYWHEVDVRIHKSFDALRSAAPADTAFYFLTTQATRSYLEPGYHETDYLVFGRESIGLPPALLAADAPTCVRIPMWNERARSLNLATSVAIVLYEALRQTRAGKA